MPFLVTLQLRGIRYSRRKITVIVTSVHLTQREVLHMTKRDIRKLSRSDLLEMLIDQSEELKKVREELDAVKEQLATANKQLDDKSITLDEAGSIADAALQINGVFDVAQASAQQYLDNLRDLCLRQEYLCNDMETEAHEKVGQLFLEAEQRCTAMESDAKLRCAEMIEKAKAEADAVWDDIHAKLEGYYQHHVGVKELMTLLMPLYKQDDDT